MTDELDAIDIETMLRGHCSPGQALFGRASLFGKGFWETHWFVKERQKRIEELINSPCAKTVGLRAGLIGHQSGAVLAPVVVALGTPTPKSVYETWMNAHAPLGIECVNDLAEQSSITVHLYNESGDRAGSIVVPGNPIQDMATELRRLSRIRTWTMDEFDAAKECVCKDFPSPWSMWQALGA